MKLVYGWSAWQWRKMVMGKEKKGRKITWSVWLWRIMVKEKEKGKEKNNLEGFGYGEKEGKKKNSDD